MNIVVLQENLSKYASLAGRLLPIKNTNISALNSFLLSARNNNITITAGDLENSIVITVPGKIIDEGECLVPAKTLLSLIPSLAGDKINILSNEKGVMVQGKGTEVKLNMEPAKDYPKTKQDKEKEVSKLTRGTLEDVVNRVCIAVSHDEARAYLGGVLLEVREGVLYAVATDGFRLSLYKKAVEGLSGMPRMIVSGRALTDVLYAIKDSEHKEVKMVVFEDGGRVGFVHAGVRYATRLLEGQFPDYQKIVPQKGQASSTTSREELYKAVKLASVFARETSNIVKMKTQKGLLIVSANSPQTGGNKTEIEAKNTGEDVEIAFNYRFLLDLLNASAEDEVMLEASGPLSPGVFTFPKDPSFLHIIMPVRLQEAQ